MNLSSNTKRLISMALEEDLGTGDVTTSSVVPFDAHVNGTFIAKQQGVICGLDLVGEVFRQLDPDVAFHPLVSDGERVEKGCVIATLSGGARAILSGERVALNFLQHLSGIATYTATLVGSLKTTTLKILDTRKTTPGLRVLEKYAVRTGGGSNHRMNLSDGIMIKDNHIKAAGGIGLAVVAARKNAPLTLKIEVETESLQQVEEALSAGADIIMLDNMDFDTMKKAVEMVNGKALTEASGNMDQKDLAMVAATGVDMVSVGALTHSVKALDISLKLE